MAVLHEISEGSSSSSSAHCHRYDVFLSFKGVDTRNGFTGHLYSALTHAGINTFLDDEEINTGEDLKPELKSAIKASRASVIVLSKNYATSTWCLEELALILEQHRTPNHIVIPIFYHVESTHVRNQQSSFGDAMTMHRQKMKAETDANETSKWEQKIDRWNKALREVADIKGMAANGRPEVGLIDEIVKSIFRKLRISSRFQLPQLIGMNNSIRFVTSWLKEASLHTIDIFTIWGMGGIGKTSLAKYVYTLHFHEFDTSAFIKDINKRCDEKNNIRMLDVQKQLYDEIARPSSVEVHDVSIYTSLIENALARKKVLLVLDDIATLDQLDVLLGSKGFHPGSKIIITTKDAWLTKSCALFKTNIEPKHATYELKGYEEVSDNLVKYCEGHPMALKVLGRSLHNRDVTYWEGYIDRLKKENDSSINNVLRMSFDSLPLENDKALFKHIACFFVGMDRDVTVTILEACDIETRSGITNLTDRCLLRIDRNAELMNDELVMHQLVQEMGRFLVRKESLDKPWERSRLWCHEESFKLLKLNKGMENVLGLTLDMSMLEKKKLHGSLELNTKALSKMDSLMLLQLNYVQITGSYDNFPKKLRWLCMHGFPLKSMPLDLSMENLVALDMSNSNIESFGICYSYPQRLHKRLKQLMGSCSKDKSLLGSLKILNLSFCEQLRSFDGFEHFPKLERLILKGCIGLLEVCESIEKCVELVVIDLSYCNKLEIIPRSICMLKKVKTLLLKGCSPREPQIEVIDMDSSEMLKANNIRINPRMFLVKLKNMAMFPPDDLRFFTISLPESIVNLSLANNNLSNESFPMDFSCLSMLVELNLDGNPIVSLPNCVRSLPRIESLGMRNCNMLTSFEHPPHTLRFLDLHLACNKNLLQKVVFDPQISLPLHLDWNTFGHSSTEFEGMVKIQPMETVEEKVLHSLGWSMLDFPIRRGMETFTDDIIQEYEIQMYYQFGIFSTIYGGEEMPNWIENRSSGLSMSFTVPPSPNKLRGLNVCCVLTLIRVNVPVIKIRNVTKDLTWVYHHYVEVLSFLGEECVTLLSHWMFGMNEMECGDQVTLAVHPGSFDVEHCGVSFVYDDGEEDEDALSYYKSWNHIIGGDLSPFQLTTGDYYLSMARFMGLSQRNINVQWYGSFSGARARFIDEDFMLFRAFSKRKSSGLEAVP